MHKDSEIVYLILSRFALKNHIFRVNLYENWKDKDWAKFLEERRHYYLDYNLPSLQAQTNQNFDYLLYIDPSFPAIGSVIEDLKTSEKENDFVKLQHVDFPWGDGGPECPMAGPLRLHVFEYVKKNYPNCKWLITTRLDTDDLLSRDFIEETYHQFRNKEEWISFRHGYCYMKTKHEYIKYSDWKSCHVIYSEPFNATSLGCKTAFHRCHAKLGLTENNTELINVIHTPNRGWWLDLIGLNTNLARNNTYLDSPRSDRLWELDRTTYEDIKQYVEFKDIDKGV